MTAEDVSDFEPFSIDEEFQKLIPKLTDSEAALLEHGLRQHGGAYTPFVVWNGLLLDGHNRYEICRREKLPYTTCEAVEQIRTRDDAKIWIIRNQLGRRNLSDIARIALVSKMESLVAERAKANQRAHGGTAPGRNSLLQNSAEVLVVREEMAFRMRGCRTMVMFDTVIRMPLRRCIHCGGDGECLVRIDDMARSGQLDAACERLRGDSELAYRVWRT